MSIQITNGVDLIIVTYTNDKTAAVVRSDSYCKGQVNFVADKNRNIIVFNTIGAGDEQKGNASKSYDYAAITLPTSTSVLDLKTTLDGWNVAGSGNATALNQATYADSYFTLTRPANSTPYSDGDAILDTVGIATQKFAAVAKAAGRGVCFTNLVAYTTDTGLAGKTINVVFYKQSPASPIADNSAFTYGAANELIRKGTVSLTFGTGIMAGVAQLGIDVNAGMLNLEICPTATDVFVQVWLPTGYTPSANSTTILFKASVIQN